MWSKLSSAVSVGLGLIAVLCLTLGALWQARPVGAAGPELEIESDWNLGAFATGEIRRASLWIRNRSSAPVRLIGSTDGCGLRFCIKSEGLPTTIAAGARFELPVEFSGGRETGDLAEEYAVYTDHPTQRELLWRIRGRTFPRAEEAPYGDARPGATEGGDASAGR
jgi:hypothetical protein